MKIPEDTKPGLYWVKYGGIWCLGELWLALHARLLPLSSYGEPQRSSWRVTMLRLGGVFEEQYLDELGPPILDPDELELDEITKLNPNELSDTKRIDELSRYLGAEGEVKLTGGTRHFELALDWNGQQFEKLGTGRTIREMFDEFIESAKSNPWENA